MLARRVRPGALQTLLPFALINYSYRQTHISTAPVYSKDWPCGWVVYYIAQPAQIQPVCHHEMRRHWARAPKYKALMFCLRGACGLEYKGRTIDFLTTSTSQALRKVLYLGPLHSTFKLLAQDNGTLHIDIACDTLATPQPHHQLPDRPGSIAYIISIPHLPPRGYLALARNLNSSEILLASSGSLSEMRTPSSKPNRLP